MRLRSAAAARSMRAPSAPFGHGSGAFASGYMSGTVGNVDS